MRPISVSAPVDITSVIAEPSTTNVPAYTRADARLEFAVTKQLSVVANGRNLLERTHRENADPTNPLTSTLVPRTDSVRLVWRF